MPGPEPGVLELVRRGHEERVLRLLGEHGALSRGRLGTLSGLSRSTLSDIVGALQARGAVVATTPDATRRGPGRPAEVLTLNPLAGQTVGLDFGHQRVHVAVANAAQEIVGTATRGYARTTSWGRRLELAVALVDSLRADLGALQGIGVGVTGAGDSRKRESELVVERLTERWGVPVLVDNNTRLAALAEVLRGAGNGCSDVVYVRLSHGIGGGVVVGGRLLRGARGTAGEIGHVPVGSVDADGLPCPCGGRGCLETYASIPAILRAAGQPDLPEALAAREAGDPAARAAFDRAGRALGIALAGVCATLSPERIIVAGEVAPAVLESAEAALHLHLSPALHHGLRLHPASLGDEVGALGALALVSHESPLLSGYPDPVRKDRA
ncbi:ROK family transcriptional regulator [Actinocorallia aurantiaca]|uniref:ROK family transcriptional regulator n=1 Tax=Actinocorallia aurantiaca TaxID=46204 RepID=A0ABN3U724_9ACTN